VTYDDQDVAAPDIDWAKCEDFNPRLGTDQIEQFITVSSINFCTTANLLVDKSSLC